MSEKNKRRPPGATTRKELEDLVWKHTPKDFRGLSEDGAREVMRPAEAPGPRVMRLSDMTESELYEQLPRGSVRAMTELEIYEAIPIADRTLFVSEAVGGMMAKNLIRYENLAIEVARLEREGKLKVVVRQVRDEVLRFAPMLNGRWAVGLPIEGRVETFATGKKKS